MLMRSENEMIKAIQTRDSSFNGLFFYGVTTTGVFCFPSCPSKAANPENIRFFDTIEAAMQAGFRSCKLCNPLTKNVQKTKLIEIVRYIEKNAEDKITLSSLGEMVNLSSSRLQRVFKAMFGVSPKAYQDAIRMRSFKHALKQGHAITDAIYASGYGSISRLYGESTRDIGMQPNAYRSGAMGEIIHYAYRQTALGLMMMAATDKGVCSVQFGDDRCKLLSDLTKEFPKADIILSAVQNTNDLDTWMEALDKHIHFASPRPDLPLDIKGTAFQIKVWQFLLSIKEGETFSYGEVADNINCPKASRAVGTACGKNPISVLIPCHRVLRSDGGLGGYRWGLDRKRALLSEEKAKQGTKK